MRRLAAVLLLATLAACSSGLALQSAWQPAGRSAAPYRNVLVVGVSDSFDRRRFFEQAVVAQLATAGVQATASSSRMTTRDALDRDRVGAIVRELGSDAVLVTRIVHQDLAVRTQQGREVLKQGNPANAITSYDPNAYTLYGYDYSMAAVPDELLVDREAAVRAELFDARTAGVGYAIDARVRIDEPGDRSFGSDVVVLDRVGRALAARLLRDGAVARP